MIIVLIEHSSIAAAGEITDAQNEYWVSLKASWESRNISCCIGSEQTRDGHVKYIIYIKKYSLKMNISSPEFFKSSQSRNTFN